MRGCPFGLHHAAWATLVALIVGCEGSGGGGGQQPPPTQTPPTVSLTASKSSIAAREPVTLAWSATNAASVVKSNFGATAVSGTTEVGPTVTTTFTITVRGPGGDATAAVTVTVVPPGAPTVNLTANPAQINPGQSTTLTWTSTGARSVGASNFGATTVSGSTEVSPATTTTYSITVSGSGGECSAEVTVTVVPEGTPTVSLIAEPAQITAGQSATLTWTSTNATTVVHSNFGAATVSGTKEVSPAQSTTYTITVRGAGGDAVATATVTVEAGQAPAPTVTITASPLEINYGRTTHIQWASTDANILSASSFAAGAVEGSRDVTLTRTTTFSLTVSGPGGHASAEVTVYVGAFGDVVGTYAGERRRCEFGFFRWVPAGEFMMGSEDAPTVYYRATPVHRVRFLRGFWIADEEVTNWQFCGFLNAIGRTVDAQGHRIIDIAHPNCKISEHVPDLWTEQFEPEDQWGDHPVCAVTWWGAKAYCEHRGVQLPTEAQWEYAARGPENRVYPWGDAWDAQKCVNADNLPWLGETSSGGSLWDGRSWCGLDDMAGNVGELVADWGSGSYYATSPLDDPPGPEVGELRTVRGGSWMLRGAPAFMCATRYAIAPDQVAADVGFRPVATSAQMGDLGQ